jgi:hypothetical protein
MQLTRRQQKVYAIQRPNAVFTVCFRYLPQLNQSTPQTSRLKTGYTHGRIRLSPKSKTPHVQPATTYVILVCGARLV